MTSRHPPPFSLRLTPAERARLESEAGGMPLGAYIRARLLEPGKIARHHDRKALAQLLGQLGHSRLASNLNQLAKAANCGTLDVGEDTKAYLNKACFDVAAMKSILIAALGLKES